MLKYFMPTAIIMGKDCVKNNAGIFPRTGKKALIVTGKNSARINGSLDDTAEALRAAGVKYEIFDRVMANPTCEICFEGAELAIESGADFIIGIGGGSPMDAAKAIALIAANRMPPEELYSGNYKDALPQIMIPTTAGTGSEVTPYSVLTSAEFNTKKSISHPSIFPKYALLDGKYTHSLNHETTVNTALDAISHAAEGMLTSGANILTDLLARESLGIFSKSFVALKNREYSRETRQSLLYASALAGMVIANTGTTAVHPMGYPLTYFHGIDHGRANGLLLPEFLRKMERYAPGKVAEILSATGLSSTDEFAELADALLGEREKIPAGKLREYAAEAAKTKNIKNCLAVLSEDEVLDIYLKSIAGQAI